MFLNSQRHYKLEKKVNHEYLNFHNLQIFDKITIFLTELAKTCSPGLSISSDTEQL